MKLIAFVLLLLAAPLAAQTIAPSQIKPGANGQTIQTVGGKAAWANTATGVTSVFGRTGDVVPVAGDYNCAQITSAICTLPSLFNQTVEVDGTAKTQRPALNFINGAAGTVSCVDNPVTLATDCTFTGGASSGEMYSIADVSGSRRVYDGTSATVYQNSTSNPMFVSGALLIPIGSGGSIGTIRLSQGPTATSFPLVTWSNEATSTVVGSDIAFTAVIMPGYWYILQNGGAVGTSVHYWTQITSTGSGGGGGGGGIPYPSGSGIPIVAGGAAWGTTVAAPAGAVVGDSDTQTLTNKSIAGSEVNSGVIPVAQIPVATGSTLGAVKPDGTSCTVSAGVLTCPGSGGYTPPTGNGFPHITSGAQDPAARGVDLSSADATGTLAAAREPAHTGDATNSAGSLAMSVGKVNGASIPTSANGVATDGSSRFIAQTSGNIDAILGGVPVTAPNFTGNLAANVLGDYTANTGTGTTLFDVSGANACSGSPCNGTFGGGSATSPTWVGQTNIHFSQAIPTQGITLPSALNAGKTFIMAYYDTPVSTTPGGTVYNDGPYAPHISSSLGSVGINFITFSPCGGGAFQTAIWNSACMTQASNFGAGFHIKVIVLGTGGGNLDKIYLDGNETPYTTQGATAGAQSSGNLFIGNSNTGPWVGQGGDWDLFRLRVYSSQLSAADVETITQIFRQDVQNRGINITPIPVNNAFPFLHCIGDSQTAGSGVTTPFCSELALTNQPTYTIDNWGIGGLQLQAMTGSDQWRVGPQCQTNLGVPSVAQVLGGTNDASQNTILTAAQWGAATFQNLAGEIQTLKRAGCTVFVSTMMSRAGSDPAGNTYDADKDAYDAKIRQLAIAAGADGITDIAANPLVGADGAAPSGGSTYWQTGGLHTTQAGTDLEAAAISAAMNYYNGTTAGNPHVVSTTPYAMVASDRFVTLSPVANVTITLPDCTGPTGAVYTIINPQSTYTVTLKTPNSLQTLNGIDYSSSGLSLPQGSLALRIGAFPPAFSGCYWSSGTSSSGGSGTVSTGNQYVIPEYTINPSGTTVGPSSIQTDSTGKMLGVNMAPTHAVDVAANSSATTLTGTNTAESEITNTNATVNTYEAFAAKSNNSSAAAVTMSKIATVNSAVTAAAESGDFHFLLRNAGTLADEWQMWHDGGFTSNGVTGGDKGAGTINVAGAYVNGAALSSTRYLSCQPGLGDGLNAIPAGTYLTTTCRNETGWTWTITAIRCVADAGSPTCNVTNGAGTALLTGAITGTSTYANGTQSGTTTIAPGDYLKITYVISGSTKQVGIDVAGTY